MLCCYDWLIRKVVRQIHAHERVTDAQRAVLGITVRDAEPRLDPGELTFLLLGTHTAAEFTGRTLTRGVAPPRACGSNTECFPASQGRTLARLPTTC